MRNVIIPITVLIVVVGVFWFASNNKNRQLSTTKQSATNELQITTTENGSGPQAKIGNTLNVHYTGTLQNGTKFDSSRDRGTPFEFTLGAGQVIKGWDQGLIGMRKGEKRNLIIPANLAYGNTSPSPLIPTGSTLVFDVELLEIK